MTLMPIYAVPGICKVNSDYSGGKQFGFGTGRYAQGRYRDGNFVRFVAGYPEKIGGWQALTSQQTEGVPRGIRDWRDNNQVVRLALGTNLKVYYYQQNALSLTDITPLRGIFSGTLTNPFTTTASSPTIFVAHNAHGLKTGDYVMLTSSAPVGGITVSGVFTNIIVINANSYSITVPVAPSGSVSGGGGTVLFTYYRITLTNPFTTISGSKTVTVAQNNHGATVGDFVTINGASAVGGLTLSGEYQIQSTMQNSYTITASSNATLSATGGGTPNLIYDISSGFQNSSLGFGYGTGGYGQNGYGTAGTVGVVLAARTWSVWPYGQQILLNPSGGTIYIWDPVIQGRAYPMYNAPSQIMAMFVTPERFVTALGTNSLGMQIAWPDQSDYTDWTSIPTNTANSGRMLQGGSYLVGGLAVRDGVSLILSNTKCFTHTYTGDNNVYADTSAGDGCGLIGPLAICEIGGVAYWMSDQDFWSYNGTTQTLPSDDIRDYVFKNYNKGQTAKFVAGTNRAKTEVWFFFCSASSLEIDSYAVFNINQNCFYLGGAAANGYTGTALQRTSWIDAALFNYPLATDASGNIYQHELGTDANGSAIDSYITFDPVDISNGDKDMDVFSFVPDFERISGNVSVSILSRIYPNDSDTVDGPYTVAPDDSTPRVDTSSNGKMAGFKIESNVLGGDWRIGTPRMEVQPAGARR